MEILRFVIYVWGVGLGNFDIVGVLIGRLDLVGMRGTDVRGYEVE
jgi:hypothetical protein